MSEWQPIETAPRDGSKFLAYWPEGICNEYGYANDGVVAECYYFFKAGCVYTDENDEEYTWAELIENGLFEEDVRQWVCSVVYSAEETDSNAPTHWMPLPDPPQLDTNQ